MKHFRRCAASFTRLLMATPVRLARRGTLAGLATLTALAIAPAVTPAAPPAIVHGRHGYTLMVHGRPYLILGAQVHNSSGWPRRLARFWKQFAAWHFNTVEVPVYWQTIEPQPGQFHFGRLDRILAGARAQHLHLVLLWFGTWKNGGMEYTPNWIKLDPARYQRVRTRSGRQTRTLSPLCTACLAADRTALTRLFTHLKQVDGTEQTVILVQIENENGALGSPRDYGTAANREFAGQVPAALRTKLKLRAGDWRQTFGNRADESFEAWHDARYINRLAAAARTAYNLPVYVNVWLRSPNAYQRPGRNYPSGGAVYTVLNIWKAATPAINMISPDIYVSDRAGYRRVLATYARPDNPLFIPETLPCPFNYPNLYLALAKYDALGFSPFGIDSRQVCRQPRAKAMAPLGVSYGLIAAAMPAILRARGTANLQAAVPHWHAGSQLLRFPHYAAQVNFVDGENSGAMVIRTAPGHYLALGAGVQVRFFARAAHRQAQLLEVAQGQYAQGRWRTKYLWNGDEVSAGFSGLHLPKSGALLRITLTRY